MVISRYETQLGNVAKKLLVKKTIVWFVNHNCCKKTLINRKNLINIDSETKYNFRKNIKNLINESFTRSNESIAFCSTKVKQNGVIHSCYNRDEIVHIERQTFKSTESTSYGFYMMLSQNLNFLRMLGLNYFMMPYLMFLGIPHVDLTNKSCCVWYLLLFHSLNLCF